MSLKIVDLYMKLDQSRLSQAVKERDLLWQQQFTDLASQLKRRSPEFITVRPLLKYLNHKTQPPITVNIVATTKAPRYQTPNPQHQQRRGTVSKLDDTTLTQLD